MPTKTTDYLTGYAQGEEAVRRKPLYAPSNPYDDDSQPDLHAGWDDGAFSAGICDIYHNGVLERRERG
jgi:hypothetical protein